MRNWIGKLLLFGSGIVVGAFLMQPGSAQQNQAPGMRLNHVGVYAKNYEESLQFYTKTMGFHEAFTVKDKDGNVTLTYLQINKESFLELAPANARPVGLGHVGLWPQDLDRTIATLRERGAKVDDPRSSSTGSRITNVFDPNGVRLELVDFLPGSEPRKAMDAWK